MKKIILLFIFLLRVHVGFAQESSRLLGVCAPKDLEKEPFKTWYLPGYENYVPNAEIISQLKKINSTKISIKIVFGSWCGDSKREVPHMLKVLDAIGLAQAKIQLIGVSDSSAIYKQSPHGETHSLNVFRVPTLIVYQNDKEVGRMVEYPIESLERDLLKIITNQPYEHAYAGYSKINTWLAQGLLADGNINVRGLAHAIRNDVIRENELNSCGYVLLKRNQIKEAISVFRMNVSLFPKSPNCYDSLGEAYESAGLKENAIACYQYVLELDPKAEHAKQRLEKLL